MRKATLAERTDPVRAATEERQAEAVARSVPTAARPPGAGLPPEVTSLLRDRLGLDPQEVRMRTDPTGARALGAEAYTSGDEVAFDEGRYAPHTEDGQRLIAHEMTHVAQQRATGQRAIQRKPRPKSHDLSPEQRFDQAWEALDLTTTDFGEALMTLDSMAVFEAGLMVTVRWEAFDLAAQSIVPTICEPGEEVDLEPVCRMVEEPNSCSIDEPAPPEYHLNESQQARYDDMKAKVFETISLYRYNFDPVLPQPIKVPVPTGDVLKGLMERLDGVEETVADVADLADLLRPEELSVPDQWKAIELLRRHMNPVQFAWTHAALTALGLAERFVKFAPETRDVYRLLVKAQPLLTSKGVADDPTAEAPLYRVAPEERRIVLLQPMTVKELAQELYGKPDLWKEMLVPYNRSRLAGAGEGTWVEAGASIYFDPTLVNESVRFMVGAVDLSKEQFGRESDQPYLTSDTGSGAVVVGNEVTYTVTWRSKFDEGAFVFWGVANDPAMVQAGKAEARRKGPQGFVEPRKPTTDWKLKADVPGMRTIYAEVVRNGERVAMLTLLEVVITVEERLEIARRLPREGPTNDEDFRAELERQREHMPLDERDDIDDQIKKLRDLRDPSKNRGMDYPLRRLDAIYVSTSGQAITAALKLFVGHDPDAIGYRNAYRLYDFSLGKASSYFKHGKNGSDTVEDLLQDFADDAPYPDGKIYFRDVRQVDHFAYDFAKGPVPMTFSTRGGPMTASLLRRLSMVAMGLGVVAGMFGQAEIAVPALWLSGALAGGGGAAEIASRLEHGDFEWDLQTGMDLLDIGAAVVSMGASSAASATVRGVGRFSLRGTIQTGIGLAQVGVMGAVHIAQIAAAVKSGDDGAILGAVVDAIRDGALLLIVHHTSKSLSKPKAGGAGTPSPTTRTSGAPAPLTTHEAWADEIVRNGAKEQAPSTKPAPLDPAQARQKQALIEFQQTVETHGDQAEVTLEHNPKTGQYRVRTGSEMHVPEGEHGWDSVMHFHTNKHHSLIRRNPAPADVEAALDAARRLRRPVTEHVAYRLPDGSLGRTAYTVEPTGRVTVEYQTPGAKPEVRSFHSLHEYASDYGSRDYYVAPDSPEARWLIEDARAFAAGGGGAQPGRRTAGGAASRPPRTTSPEVRRQTPGYAEVPLTGPRLAEAAAKPGPQNLRPGEVLVDPSGLATWRDPAGNIWSEHPVLPQGIGRSAAPNYNEKMPDAARYAAVIARVRPGWVGLDLDWAHGVGQSYGMESPIDLMLAPRLFNQTAENIFVEGFDRAVRRKAADLQLVRTVKSKPIDPSDRMLSKILDERTYRLEGIDQASGRRFLIYEVGMRPAADGTMDLDFLRSHVTLGGDPRVARLIEKVSVSRTLDKPLSGYQP